jgi:transcription-repair coupling factor (superfamily II helicase)
MEQNQVKTLISLIENIKTGCQNISCSGLAGSEKAYLIVKISEFIKKKIIILASSQKEADMLIEDIGFFKKIENIIPLPFYKNILNASSFNAKDSALRIKALYNLLNYNKNYIAVIPAPALLQKIIPKKQFIDFAELILPNEELDRDFLIKKLVSGGYSDSIIVEEAGEYCVRGGIIDIFSPQYENPVRIEFFGDQVESIRFFSPITQRTIKETDEAVILPAADSIIEDDKLLYKDPDSIFDYLDNSSIFINFDSIKNEKSAKEFYDKKVKDYLLDENKSITPEDLYIKWENAAKFLLNMQTVNFKSYHLKTAETDLEATSTNDIQKSFNFHIKDNDDIREELKNFYNKDNILKPLADWITDKKDINCPVIAVCGTGAQADRLKFLMSPYGIDFGILKDFNKLDIKKNKAKSFICRGYLSSGFLWQEEGFAIITEKEIFGVRKRKKKVSHPSNQASNQAKRLIFEDLKTEDFIVHIEHGIGKYMGLVKLKMEKREGDFLHLEYKDNDRLYLPVDRMSMIQKYIGMEDTDPVIDKLGGIRWEKIKQNVKKSIEKIAGELISIYAARKVNKGHAFSKSDAYFQDFEASFPYEETADQIKAIDEVLEDMEKDKPMDRLICGDVGYGKTEVAIRAAFKAANDGKQTAVLAPTTILVQQHYMTFKERFAKYPITIEYLNRFKSPKEQKEIIKRLKEGKVDIIIGTHRLVQKDVEFKELGLLVLDEEQRFGVAHKEKLKKFKKTVDVLTLSATPIPRTLHMSLMGIRDISVISTPPEGRRSIITYISEFNETLAQEAIQSEVERGGQIFFVHNNINTIWTTAKYIQSLVPHARIGVAHGRLDKKELENIMLKFLKKEIDLLICTTIIESGLDIPNANTIIINRADRFGLSQLYQLRGRVGRAGEQAFAYFFISKESLLTKNAQKRLKVLMEHTDLGSGFQIAMKDLQIRGGGNMIGVSQSGKIAAVGYDMYLKLMEEAVLRLKGEEVKEKLEPEINVNIPAFISEIYIQDIDMRLATYRNLSKISDIKELIDFKEELQDRYGKIPKETKNLIIKVMIKILAVQACVKKLDVPEKSKIMILYFSKKHLKNTKPLIDMIFSYKNRFELVSDYVLKVNINAFGDIKTILKEIGARVRR